MDLFSSLAQSITDGLSLITTMPFSALFVIIVGMALALVSSIITAKLTDLEEMQEKMEQVKEWRNKYNEARKTMDPILLEEVMAEQQRILRIQTEMMGSRCKPMLIFYLPFLAIYYFLSGLYGLQPVAILPFNPQDALPFLEGWLGTNVPGSGFGLYFWPWYFLASLSVGNLIRRLFSLDPGSMT
ncbi:MAG: DUF106 domain-containing protein [Candidatus Lokiarchaeota archaeon]|nr:DUF106 domain-containing protein [Candidatus Lokiarchaeota archaeon]